MQQERQHLKVVSPITTGELLPLAQATVYQQYQPPSSQYVSNPTNPNLPSLIIIGAGCIALVCTIGGYAIATANQSSQLITQKAQLAQAKGNLEAVKQLVCH